MLLTSLIMTQVSDNVVFAEEAKKETAEDKEVIVIENVAGFCGKMRYGCLVRG